MSNVFDMFLSMYGLSADTIPELSVKFKDRVCYRGGVKVAYEDITKFTLLDDGMYGIGLPVGTPLEGKVVDVLPVLCIGIAAAAAAQGDGSGDGIRSYTMDMLKDVSVFGSFREAVNIFSDIAIMEFDEDTIVNFAYSLIACQKDCLFEQERDLAVSLFALALANRKEFVRLLFKSMRGMLITLASEPWRTDSPRGFSAYGNAKYETYSGTKRRLTDARGLGYLFFMKFSLVMYMTFGDFGEKVCRNVCEEIDKCIEPCIGMDIAGRYLKGRGFLPAHRSENVGLSSLGFVCFEHNRRIELDEHTTSYREAYENALMYRRVHGCDDEAVSTKLGCANMRWFSPGSLCRELAYLAFDYPECTENLLVAENKLQEHLSRITTLEGTVLQLKQERIPVRAEVSDQGELEAMKARVQDLEWQLSKKAGIIESLSEELSDLKSCMANYYSSDEPEETEDKIESQVENLTEIVRYINDFKFLLVGGRSDLVSRLEKLGWTNIVGLDNATAGASTLPQADFVVLNTSFVAHKIVYLVNSHYSRDLVMYYNGTNTVQLVRSAYDFVKRYLEGGN